MTHDLGHVLRLPDASDVVKAIETSLPASALAPAETPVVAGTAGNDTIDAGHGANILFGGAGADTFVFAQTPQAGAGLTHVADYSSAQGDILDVSALTSAFHASGVDDAMLVRAVEDPSGQFATLQLLNSNPYSAPVSIAQLVGVHAGDAIDVLIDSHAAIHLAQLHVGLLV